MTVICRTCLQEFNDTSNFYLNSTDCKSSTITTGFKLSFCVPEMDLDVVPDAVICESCMKTLTMAYEFKNKCLETESKIQSYIEQMGYLLTSINLKDIVQQSETVNLYDKNLDFLSYLQPGNCTQTSENSISKTSSFYDTNRNPILTNKEEETEKSLDLKNLQCDTKDFFAVPKIAQLLASTEISLRCTQCSYTTSNDKDLKNHEKFHSNQDLHKCTECGYSAPKRQTLIVHMRKHMGDKLFTCNNCGFSTQCKDTLVQHIKLHSGGERPYKCTLCNFSSLHNSALDKHTKTHTNESTFKCGLCDYKGRLKFDINKHMRLHTGEKLYKCVLCDYSSSHKTKLCYHMRAHTREKPYKCKLCTYRSSHRTNLQNHLKTHNNDVKHFKCNQCKFTTFHSKLLINHQKTHEEKYTFSDCNYDTSLKTHLIQHEVLHEEKALQCFNCGYKTASKSDLEEHISIHNTWKDSNETALQCKNLQLTPDLSKSFTENSNSHRAKETSTYESAVKNTMLT